MVLAFAVGILSPLSGAADAVVGGSVVMSYDQAGFAALGLGDINSFNQATANTSTRDQILTDPGTTTSWNDIGFGINPTTPLTDPTGRTLQVTTFSYSPLDLTGTAAGQIGVGGATRWTVDPLAGGGLFVLGDYSVSYDASRVGGVYSGWFLKNNFDLNLVAFDLGNVTTTVSADGFKLSGDLIVKPLSPLTLFGFTGGKDYGDISISAQSVPEPSVYALVAVAGIACFAVGRRKLAS